MFGFKNRTDYVPHSLGELEAKSKQTNQKTSKRKIKSPSSQV
jgi:hypothetical protein